ncbi:MAG: glutathione S-transferase family protein [Cellvibrionaceae bacterium]
MRIYTGPLSLFAKKVQIAAREKNLALEVAPVPFNMHDQYRQKHPEVVRINPKQQVPVLVDGDLELFDSTVICEYFEDLQAQPPLWPSDPRARAHARLWELKVDEVLAPEVIALMDPQARETPALAKPHHTRIQAFYFTVDEVLDTCSYLAGDFSYADIAMYITHYFAGLLGAKIPETMPNLRRWRKEMEQRESVQAETDSMREYLQKHVA